MSNPRGPIGRAAAAADDEAAEYDAAGNDMRPPPSDFVGYKVSPTFRSGRTLRNYQLEGLNWMTWNWFNHRSW